jgi:hypothetical protein
MMGRPEKLGKQTPVSFLDTESLGPIADIPQNFPNMDLVEVLQDFDNSGRGLKFFKGILQEDIDCVLNVAILERQRYREFMACLNEFITQGKLKLATSPNWQTNEKTTQAPGTKRSNSIANLVTVSVKSLKNLDHNGPVPVSHKSRLSWNNGAGLESGLGLDKAPTSPLIQPIYSTRTTPIPV